MTQKIKTYKDLEYIVFYNDIGFYCGYVRIPDNHPYNKLIDKTKTVNLKDVTAKMKGEKPPKDKTKDRVFHIGYNDIDIDCHGGLTFSRRITGKDWPQGFTFGAWIGWDYGHAGDKINYRFPEELKKEIQKIKDKYPMAKGWEDKEWTAEEVEKDCKNVIDQLLNVGIPKN